MLNWPSSFIYENVVNNQKGRKEIIQQATKSLNKMDKYFAFIDESGNNRMDRFFGLGILMIDVENAGRLFEALKPFYINIFNCSRNSKAERLDTLIEDEDFIQLKKICGSLRNFEMKFKYIGFRNNLFYKELIERYFNFPTAQFCCLVFDREKHKDRLEKFDPWNAYINNAAMLLSNNIKRLPSPEICVLADDLTQPKGEDYGNFEDTLTTRTLNRMRSRKVEGTLFGVTRVESHSSIMVQLVDILVGCVMFDFKLNAGLIKDRQFRRKNVIVEKCRELLKKDTLAKNFTKKIPNYFSVWEFTAK